MHTIWQHAHTDTHAWNTSKRALARACARILQSERLALQWVAWEKQQKEIEKQKEIIQRLSGGSQSGRAGQVCRRCEGLLLNQYGQF